MCRLSSLLVATAVWACSTPAIAQSGLPPLVVRWVDCTCDTDDNGALATLLMNAAGEVEPGLIAAAMNGPDTAARFLIAANAGTQFDITQAEIAANGATAGMTPADIQRALSLTRDVYIAQEVGKAVNRYRSRALSGLGVIATSTALQVLATFAQDNTSPLQHIAQLILADTGTGTGDRLPPTTTASLSPMPNSAGWNNQNVVVTLTATDNTGGSGVKWITYSAVGAQPTPSTTVAGAVAEISLIADGITTLSYFGTDTAGNLEGVKMLAVKIDKTAPLVTCAATPSQLWPPDSRLIPVTVSIQMNDVSDTTFTLVSVTSNEANAAADIRGFVVGTSATSGLLRARRAGSGSGRIYTLQYRAVDQTGNAATCNVTVGVSQSQGASALPTFTSIDYPGAKRTVVRDIEDTGKMLGGYGDDPSFVSHGFIYDGATFTRIDRPGAVRTVPLRMNKAGDIVGFFYDPQGIEHGFLFRAGAFTTIDYPGAAGTSAESINDIGQIVGFWVDAQNTGHGFVLDLATATFRSIDVPGATTSNAIDIDNAGHVVGFYLDAQQQGHGFRYDWTTFQSIDYPGATLTSAIGLNVGGRIAGVYEVAGVGHGFVLDGTSFKAVDYPGATRTELLGLNDARQQVVGDWRDGLGRVHGFVVTVK